MEFWKLLLQWSAPDPAHVDWSWRRLVHRGILAAQVVWDALFAFVTEEALIRASSLAFTSVLALVPLMTVALRVMNFYGVSEATREQFEAVLAQYLLPAQSRDVVNLMLSAASQVTQNIGAMGLAGFCLTLVLMARELEGHIQKICGAKGSLATSLLHYSAFLVLAPTGALVAFGLLHPLAALLALLPGDFSRHQLSVRAQQRRAVRDAARVLGLRAELARERVRVAGRGHRGLGLVARLRAVLQPLGVAVGLRRAGLHPGLPAVGLRRLVLRAVRRAGGGQGAAAVRAAPRGSGRGSLAATGKAAK